jgi:hypothetical protein
MLTPLGIWVVLWVFGTALFFDVNIPISFRFFVVRRHVQCRSQGLTGLIDGSYNHGTLGADNSHQS